MFLQTISIVFGLGFFIVPLWAYRRGLKDGLAINQGKSIEPIKTPIQMIEQHKEQKKTQKQEDYLAQGVSNIMSYVGDVQESRGER